MFTRHLLIYENWGPTSKKGVVEIFSYASDAAFNAAIAKPHGNAREKHIIRCEDDLVKVTMADLITAINAIRTGTPIKALHTRGAGVKRLWALLTTRQDPADGEPEPLPPAGSGFPQASDAPPSVEKTSSESEKSLDASDSVGYEEGTAASATEQTAPPSAAEGDDDMATKNAKKTASKAKKAPAAKKAKAVKTVKPKAETLPKDAFGLRKDSNASEAAKMFARASGATMAAVVEKTGDTQYNLLTKLKEAGHKVKKDGTTIFLTLKA